MVFEGTCEETFLLDTSSLVLHAATVIRLNTQLVLKGSQWGSGVVGPVTPGASGQAVLTKAALICQGTII